MMRLFFVIVLACSMLTTNAQTKGCEKSIELGYQIEAYSKDAKPQITKTINAFSVMFMNGYRISELFFAGVGVDYSVWDNKHEHEPVLVLGGSTFESGRNFESVSIPVVARVKLNPMGGKIAPYLRSDFGYNIATKKQEYTRARGYYGVGKCHYKSNGFLFNPAASTFSLIKEMYSISI